MIRASRLASRTLHGLADGGAFVGNVAAVQGHEAADEAGIGMIGLDVLAQQCDPFLQIIDRITVLQNHPVHGHYAIQRKAGNQTGHNNLLYGYTIDY